jgi:hypothetical protein
LRAELSHGFGGLLEKNLNERCIAGRLVMYLQELFPEQHVDVEYNRHGDTPKRLGLPEECANYWNEDGEALVVPDVIVHRRGEAGPNILIVELKKTTNERHRTATAGAWKPSGGSSAMSSAP